MPLRDFWTSYPPGMFWLLGLAFKIFGEQLLVNRLMHAVFVLGICVVSYYLVLSVSRSRRWAMLGFMAVTLYAGAVRVNYGYPPVLCTLLGLLGLLVLLHGSSEHQSARSVLAGLSAGFCAIVRYDFAIYIVAASSIALGAGLPAAPEGGRKSAQLAKSFAFYGTGLLVPVLIAYGVVVGEAGLSRTYALLVDFPLQVYPRARDLPFTWPFASLRSAPHSVWSLAVLLVYECARVPLFLPFLVAPAGAVAGLVLVSARPRRRPQGALLLGLSLLAIALINQYRVRSGEPQGWPLAVVGLVATISLLSVVSQARRPLMRATARGCVLALCAVLIPGALYREGTLIRARYFYATVAVDSPWAVGIRIPAGQASYNGLLRYLADRHRAGEAYLYSGVVDHDQLVFNDVLVYFLSGMRSPTFFPELAPGVVDTSAAQSQIVREMDAHAVRTVVLYDWVSTEPNESSVNKNIDIADAYIHARYQTVARFESYTVMERKDE